MIFDDFGGFGAFGGPRPSNLRFEARIEGQISKIGGQISKIGADHPNRSSDG